MKTISNKKLTVISTTYGTSVKPTEKHQASGNFCISKSYLKGLKPHDKIEFTILDSNDNEKAKITLDYSYMERRLRTSPFEHYCLVRYKR